MDPIEFKGKNGCPMAFICLAQTKDTYGATFSFDNTRYVLNGIVSIDKTIGSYKYKPELKIDVWTDQPIKKEIRNNERWNINSFS